MEKREIPYLALGGIYEQDDVEAATKIIAAATQPGGSFFPLPALSIHPVRHLSADAEVGNVDE